MKKIALYALLFVTLPALVNAVNLTTSETLQLAWQGDAEAQYTVGRWTYEGSHSQKRDHAAALQWWAKAALQGHARAIGEMGRCYRYADGVHGDSIRALGLYVKSIKSGNEDLLNQVLDGADKHSPFDCIVASQCYKTGTGVMRNKVKSAECLLAAAQAGSIDGMREYALVSLNSRRAEEAISWFDNAAGRGDVPSTYFSGMMRLQGLGIEADTTAGLDFVRRAAASGFAQADYDLSRRYASGDAVEQDTAKWMLHLRKSAIEGSHHGRWDYATALRDGRGCNRSYQTAMQWMARMTADRQTAELRKAYCDKQHPDTTAFFLYLKGRALCERGNYTAARLLADSLTTLRGSDGIVLRVLIDLKESNMQPSDALKRECIERLQPAAADCDEAKVMLAGLHTMGDAELPDSLKTQCLQLLDEACARDCTTALCLSGTIYYEMGAAAERSQTSRSSAGNAETYLKKAALRFLRAHQLGMLTTDAASLYTDLIRRGIDTDAIATTDTDSEKTAGGREKSEAQIKAEEVTGRAFDTAALKSLYDLILATQPAE